MERCTCSRDDTTLPSWTSSTMVRTWRLVTEAGVGRGASVSHRGTYSPTPTRQEKAALTFAARVGRVLAGQAVGGGGGDIVSPEMLAPL